MTRYFLIYRRFDDTRDSDKLLSYNTVSVKLGALVPFPNDVLHTDTAVKVIHTCRTKPHKGAKYIQKKLDP